MRISAKDIFLVLVLVLAIFITINLVVANYIVSNNSMYPQLQPGEHLLINKMAFSFDEPARGDLVCYESPDVSKQLKRIIGLPGDVVEIKNDAIYVNSVRLTEPYVKKMSAYSTASYQVPLNNYFVLEDNRKNSDGSSIGWTIPRDNVVGRAWICTWPPDKWGTVDGYPLDSELASVKIP